MATLTNWIATILRWHKEDVAEDEQTEQDIKRAFQTMYDTARKDINAYYAEYATTEGVTIAEAKRRVSQLDAEATERRYQELRDAGLSEKALQEARLLELTMNVNRLQNLQANIGFSNLKAYDKLDKFFNERLTNRSATQLRRNSGMLDMTADDIQQTAEAIANSVFKNATYSERLWANQSELQNDIASQIANGFIQGKTAQEMARDIQAKYGGKMSDAQRLMRTELRRAQTEADKISYTARGIKYYTYHTEIGCCDKCRELNKKRFLVADMEVGVNAPPMHPNCRCALRPLEEQEHKPIRVRFMEWWHRLFGRESVENTGTEFTNEPRNSIINTRYMSNGLRRSPLHKLDETEIEEIIEIAKQINIPTHLLSFNTGDRTGLDVSGGKINIRGDIFPDYSSNANRDNMSVKAVLAHEYYGHYMHRDTELAAGDWRDEFRASYTASINAPNLTAEERRVLMIDAYDRARESGVTVSYNSIARKYIHGKDTDD